MGVFFGTRVVVVVVTLAIDDNDGDEVSLMPCSKFRGFCRPTQSANETDFPFKGFLPLALVSFFRFCGFTSSNWNKQAKLMARGVEQNCSTQKGNDNVVQTAPPLLSITTPN